MTKKVLFKKAVLASLVLCTSSGLVYAQNTVNIPDNNFKNALLNLTPAVDTNEDGQIQLTEAQSYTEAIDVSDANIVTIEGIEAFTSITDFNCAENEITTIDLSALPQLKKLDCSENLINSLILPTNSSLEVLICSDNKLVNLNVSGAPNLKELHANYNELISLSLNQNPLLEKIFCEKNKLSALDLSQNPQVKYLQCSKNQELNILNIKNQNNANMVYAKLNLNPNLECIEVDNATEGYLYNTSKWIKDPHANFQNTCPLSVKSIEALSVKVFPNPTKEVLNITTKSTHKAKLYSTEGKLLLEKILLKGENKIEINFLPKGIYFLTIDNSATKIIKE
ncbi:T9SS type A sorting domain-containing protein [Capnocytophaga sp. ARDL2]|uniref:T9SS type A sorting domain-containing protein n=1 Tax=Capnocytophaga sp. ARDL2 TaxID=3238809 RepID=UPI003556AFD0